MALGPGPGVRGLAPRGQADSSLVRDTPETGFGTSVGEGYLPRGLRVRLFEEVVGLRKNGLTYGRIIDEVWRKYGIKLSKSNVSYWTRGIHSPYNGRRIPSIDLLRPSEELAYVIGVKLGDGYTTRRRCAVKSYNSVKIGLKVKDSEFAVEFARCLTTVLGRRPLKPRYRESSGRYEVEVRSQTLYELLKKPVELDRLKKYIAHYRECTAAFIRGFADSEGSIGNRGDIRICNTDLVLLTYVKDLLRRLGIASTGPKVIKQKGLIGRFRNGYYRRNKDCYYFYVRTSSNITFYKKIGFTIQRKQEHLENHIKRRPAKPLPLLFPSHVEIWKACVGGYPWFSAFFNSSFNSLSISSTDLGGGVVASV